MADAKRLEPVKALDGSVQAADTQNGVTIPLELAEEQVLADRTKATAAKSDPLPEGAMLTGKQEHYLKRELLSQQVNFEITDLASPTALQRFGAPFGSDHGEVSPQDSEFPILRYIFVNHLRNFPFLDQAREKEFWQDKLQVFLEHFANKHISSSEDRLEETKRRKLALKAKKVVELMMVSGIPTASGYEEHIKFAEMEVVDRNANETGLKVNVPDGEAINGWNINVAGVRTVSIKRTVRYHQHAQFIIRIRRQGQKDVYIGRRYGEFVRLHKRLRTELPGKLLPPLPRKNKGHTVTSFFGGDEDGASDAESVSSASASVRASEDGRSRLGPLDAITSARPHSRSISALSRSSKNGSRTSLSNDNSAKGSPISSPVLSQQDVEAPTVTLFREEQRVSLRAFLRTILQNQQVANSKAMADFFNDEPLVLNGEELRDIERRRAMDEKRVEEQRKFYEIARQRAKELDVYMEKFRRDVVERNGLTRLFEEIKEKPKIEDLSIEYKKFAEWARIEVAATLYHLFLAEDNSPEMFAQAKRIHSMMPYGTLKQVIRYANPTLVMRGVLDLFLAQPFGARSLAQRVLGMAVNDGIRQFQRAVDSLAEKVGDPVLCTKLRNFCYASEDDKNNIRSEAFIEDTDLIVAILRSETLEPEISPEQIGTVFNAYVAWNNAVDNVDAEMVQGARMFADMKQLLKMHTRQRDKEMMLSVIEEPVTVQLFRDLFTIFYEPLVRVYKSANVYNSVTDFAAFAEDAIKVIERCQHQDASADPNQTVQSFIDLCERHEADFYKFVREVHLHDNGLFTQLMGWIEGILDFLRNGPKGGKLDMNALFQGAVESSAVNKSKAIAEIDALTEWQVERKRWHNRKTRQKMGADTAANGAGSPSASTGLGSGALMPGADFDSSAFGLAQDDLDDLNYDDELSDEEDSEDEDEDPIVAERRRRVRKQDHLRRSAGEPVKPPVEELTKLKPSFLAMLRNVLAD